MADSADLKGRGKAVELWPCYIRGGQQMPKQVAGCVMGYIIKTDYGYAGLETVTELLLR